MANDGLMAVNFGNLQSASEAVQKASNDLDSKLQELETKASRLIDTWNGEAQEAYWAQQKVWSDASKDLQQILLNIKRALDESHDDYTNTERAATQRFQ